MGAKKKTWITRIGVLVSVLFLYLFLKDIDFPKTFAAIRQAKPVWLLAGCLAILGSLAGRAFRWRVFLGAQHRGIGIGRLFNTLTIGFFGNTILPARAGEFLRPYMLARAEPVRFTEAFATVVVERVFDLIVVVLAFAVTFVLAPFPEEVIASRAETFSNLKFFGAVMAAATIAGTGMLCLMVRAPLKCRSIFSRLIRWLPSHFQDRLLHALQSFIDGLSAFGSLGAFLRSLLWTGVIWFTILLSEYFTILAFGFEVSLFGTMILMSLLAFSVMVPQAPGYLGPFHLATELTLVILFGVAEAPAKAYAIVLWFVQIIPILLAGIVCLHLEGLNLSQMWRSAKAHEKEEAA